MTNVFFGAGRIVHNLDSDNFCEFCDYIERRFNGVWESGLLAFTVARIDVNPVDDVGRVLFISGGGISQRLHYEYAVKLFTLFRDHVRKTTSAAVYICFTETGVEVYDCAPWSQADTALLEKSTEDT